MNMLANIFMRAPGESVGTFALESAIDELAIELEMDPIELRIGNEPDKDPISGLPFSSRHSCGNATATLPYIRMPGAAARMTLTRDGAANVEVAAHEMGHGTARAGKRDGTASSSRGGS
jgi:xanthine dehydrogenase YagR molybdenum-binding subunit